MTGGEHIPGGPLTDEEVKEVRRIIRDDGRMRWLWATIRIWAGYTSAAIIGAFAIYEGFLRFLGRK